MKSSITLAVAALIIISAGPGHATFPGENGRIAFIQGPDVYTMKPDGTDVRQLTNLGPSNNGSFWANWSPDGQQLVFTEFPPNASPQLWMMNADGTNQHLVLSDPAYADDAPSFSPDGSDVVFARCQASCAIYRVRADGTGLTAITDFEPGATFDFEPAFSPDGRRIAFHSVDRDGILAAIYLVNVDGSDIRRLTPPAPGAVTPDWSPDGEKVAFMTHCCNPQTPEIWAISDDGSLTQLTDHDKDTKGDANPSWSPQGDAVVFQRIDPSSGASAIFIVNADGSGLRQMRALPRSEPRKIDLAMRERNPMKRHLKQIELGGGYPRWGPAPR